MMIKKIELHNITTHKRTTIEFQEGLNMLLGQNGTGKSTVLNMIGYVLFDYLPGSQKSYIRTTLRKTPKFGVVKLWILGLNDDLFIVERTIGKTKNTIEISDARTGIIVQNIDNKSDLIAWLKTQFSLRKDLNLSNVFETSIGIPQGTFTEPFLRSPTERMKFFNPILKVDVYRNVFEKSVKIVRLFEKEIHEVEVAMSRIEGELQEKEKIEKETDQLEEEIDRSQSELKQAKDEFNELSGKYDTLIDLEKRLREAENQCKELEFKEKNNTEKIESLNKDLLEAKNSEKTCKLTLMDYNRHNEFIIEEKKLQELNSELQKIKESKSNSEQKMLELNAQVKGIKAQVLEISKIKKDFPFLKKKHEESENLQKKIEELGGEIRAIKAYQENLKTIKERNLENVKRKFELEDKLKNLPKFKEEYSQLEALQNKYNNTHDKKIALEIEISQLEKNMQNSKEGNCPFLNEKCKNIEGDSLLVHFRKQLAPLKEEVVSLSKILKNLNLKIEKTRELRENIEELTADEGELKSIKKLYSENIVQIKELNDKVKSKNNKTDSLNELTAQKEKLSASLIQYQLYKEKIEIELPKLELEESKLVQQLKPLEKSMKPLDKKISELKSVPEKLEKIKKELERTIKNHDKYQMSINLAKKVPDLEDKLKKQVKLLSDNQASLKTFSNEKSQILSSFSDKEFNEIKLKKEKLNDQIVKIKTIIEGKQALLLKHGKRMEKFVEIQQEFDKLAAHGHWLNYSRDLIEILRLYFKEAGPKITEALLSKITQLASEIYRDLVDADAVQLRLENDYNVKLTTPDIEKDFNQLSGGEQMAVAISVRLSILKILTNADFAFFDEPTTNLDSNVRLNLAKCIQNVKGFRQLFIISHDDTFEENAENVIKFLKDDEEISHVSFLNS